MIQPLPDPLLSESVAPLADAGLCGVGANDAPHEPQNVDPAIASVPHFEQNTVGGVGVDGGVVSGAGFDSDVGSGVGSGVGDP
jgi:hypothetical protein